MGASVVTVFFGPAQSTPVGGAHYLDLPDLADSRQLSAALAERYGGARWDLLICHRYRAFQGARKAGLTAQRKIVLAHEYDLLKRRRRRLGRMLLGRDFEFAGVAPEVAAQLAQHTGHAIVIPNVLADSTRDELLSREDALSELGLDPGPLTIGAVGRLHYKKRPELALQAFAQLREQRDDVRLVFLGDGEARESLLEQAGPEVHLLGNVPGAQRLFRAFDALLHTAVAEPFGMVILEAMCAGVPVACSPGHGPEHVLQQLGFYAATDDAEGYADALQTALEADRRSIDQQGLERVGRHFSVESLSKTLQRLITGEPLG